MTAGERIQACRKQLGLSQEELGQKLLVSRQTISLWEKDQTVPTIDNLIRLREIFGVSVDEILGFETSQQNSEILPDEAYRFEFDQKEIKELQRLQIKAAYKRPVFLILICIFAFIYSIAADEPMAAIGFISAWFLFAVSALIATIRSVKKLKTSYERIGRSTYEYKVFSDYINISIYYQNEKTRESKCCFSDIENIRQVGKWLFLQYGGQFFILRKSDLLENSVFYTFMHNDSAKKTPKPLIGKWKIVSWILFWASILSIYGAMMLVVLSSGESNINPEKMWLFFLMTPIPIASIVFGKRLKKKGLKYKKNLIVGIIMTVTLCLYGSFSFFLADVFRHDDAPIIKIEETMGIDIPEHKEINTQDWTNGSQSVTRGYIYYTSDVYFDNQAVEEFEKQMQNDGRWLSTIPNELIGISTTLMDRGRYDYALIYNIDTSEYNKLPDSGGKFHFISVAYRSEQNQMQIIEYDIDYVK